VVREDPVRQGLLFAGTERAIYVSFNDGDYWQSLQLNLPATSMRDLVIHENDIVVGTHGRSFWILDDITPLRQLSAEVINSKAHLFHPAAAYRVRRNVNTDTPLPPEEPAGKNPPDGTIIDYFIQPSAADLVKLEIIDPAGKVLRTFSSADKPDVNVEQLGKELNVPLYWIRPPQILSAEPGMHRFVWDLRVSPPRSIHHEYPISAIPHDTPRDPRGPSVLPGTYSVRLSVGQGRGQSGAPGSEVPEQSAFVESWSLEIKMDPRVTTPTAQLEQQFALASRICEQMNATYAGLAQVRGLRSQLKELGGQAPKGDLADAIAALDQRVAPLEGTYQQFGSPSPQDSFAQLNGQFGQLLEVVDGADAVPTQTAQDAFADRQRALATVNSTWDDIKAHSVSTLNDQLLRAKLAPIDLSKTIDPQAQNSVEDEP
jgi:hypothetical protein